MDTNDIIILLGSSRKNGNTKKFVSDSFPESTYKLIDLLDHEIAYYNYEGLYPDNDEFYYIIDLLIKYDIIIFATPVYWYAMSGLLKTFFDRLTDVVTINKTLGRKLQGKFLKVMAVGADAELPVGFDVPFKDTAKYLGMHYDSCAYRVTKD